MNDLNLKGKSILFISPVFYDYHTVIKENLEYLGAKVFLCRKGLLITIFDY